MSKSKTVRTTRSSKTSKGQTKSASVTTSKADNIQMEEDEETAYERLLGKVKENKDIKTKKAAATTPKKRKLSVAAKDVVEPSVSAKRNTSVSARFFEDDNFVDITVDMNKFLSEDDNLSEDEGDEVSFNNNATMAMVAIDRTSNPFQKDGWSERSADSATDHQPATSIPQVEPEECNRSSLSMELMQNYLLKSGVIQSGMSEEEIQEILQQEPNVQMTVRQQPAETEPRRANLPSSSAKGSKQLVTGRKNDY